MFPKSMTRMVARAIAAFGFVLALGAVTAADGWAKEKVSVAFFSWPGYAYWFLVKEKNLAPELDLDIQIIEDPSESFNLMTAGRIDVISSTMEYAPIAAEAGHPIKFVMFQDTCYGSDNIVLAPGIQGAQDVKGKKFIAMEGGLSQIYAGWWLEQNGVGIDEVQWVNVIMDDAAAAMIAGEAAAGEFWEPYGSTVLRGLEGSRVASNCREEFWLKTALLSDGVFMNSDFIDKRRDVAVAVIRAYWEAYRYWRENPQEAAQIMADGLKFSVEDVERVIGPGAVREDSLLWMYDFAESSRFCGVKEGDPPFGQTNGQLFDVMRGVNEWWIKFGYMKETIATDRYVDCSLMEELHQAGYAAP